MLDSKNGKIVTVPDDTNKAESSITPLLELNETDRLLLKYLIAYPKFKAPQLAKILELNESYVRGRLRRPCFKLAYQKLQGTTDSLMQEAAKKAAYRLIELIDHPNPDVALRAIKIALQKYINQISDATFDRILVFKSTIAPDGNLLQSIVRNELQTIDAEVEDHGPNPNT